MIIIAIPLITMIIINVFNLETLRTDYFTIYRLQNERVAEFSFRNFPSRFITLLQTLFTCDTAPFDALDGFNTLYTISIPFCIIGFLYCIVTLYNNIRNKTWNQKSEIITIMLFYLLAQLVVGCAISSASIYQMNGIYCSLLFLLVCGLYAIFLNIKLLFKKIIIAHVSLILIMSIYIFNYNKFHEYYFNVYPNSIDSIYLFTPRLDEVLGTFDIKIQTYPTYIEAYYLYYMLEKRVDPYLAQIPLEGLTSYETITFQSPTTTLPMPIDLDKVYVINHWNQEYIDLLSMYPFEQCWTDDYIIFYK